MGVLVKPPTTQPTIQYYLYHPTTKSAECSMLESAVTLMSFISFVTAHQYYNGGCPNFTPMQGFDWNKFSVGLWYVTEKFDTNSTCLTYSFKEDSSGVKSVEQVRQLTNKNGVRFDHDYIYAGKLSVPDESNLASMMVKFPLNRAGLASYTVLDTDYNSCSMVCTCQDFKIFWKLLHRVSCSILQRSPLEDLNIADKVELEGDDILIARLKKLIRYKYARKFGKINHDGCQYERGKAKQIDVYKILANAIGSNEDEVFDFDEYPSVTEEEKNAIIAEFSRNVESSAMNNSPDSY